MCTYYWFACVPWYSHHYDAIARLLHHSYMVDKKILAEHAAAARAYDCWCLRLEGQESNFLGKDEPYRSAEDAPKCPLMPTEAKERIRQLQEEAKTRMPIPFLKPSLPMQTDEEEQKDRDEYRAARRSAQGSGDNNMNEEW